MLRPGTGAMSRRRALWPLLVFLPVSLAILFALLRASGTGPELGGSGRQVQAVVPTAVSLAPAADVRIAGVRVGRVEQVARRGREAVVLMRLQQDAPAVFRDARVDIRSRTVVGESFVALDPGTPSAGELPVGDTLGSGRAVEATQFDELASLFDPATRNRVRGQVAALGDAFTGEGGPALNAFVEDAAAASTAGAPVLETLAAGREDVAGLVEDLGDVTRALGDREADLRVLATRGTRAVAALGRERRAVRRALAALPATLTQAEETTGRLARFADGSTTSLRDLRLALDALRPSLDVLAPTAISTRRALDELERFAPRGQRVLRRARRASGPVEELLRPVDETLAEVNPMLEYLAPYDRELAAFFANLGSMVGLGDSLGNLARLAPIVSVSALATAPKEFLEFYDRLKELGLVRTFTGAHGMNPFPAPGTIGDPRPFTGAYPRVEAARIPGR